jgi:hypothetical protein
MDLLALSDGARPASQALQAESLSRVARDRCSGRHGANFRRENLQLISVRSQPVEPSGSDAKDNAKRVSLSV